MNKHQIAIHKEVNNLLNGSDAKNRNSVQKKEMKKILFQHAHLKNGRRTSEKE